MTTTKLIRNLFNNLMDLMMIRRFIGCQSAMLLTLVFSTQSSAAPAPPDAGRTLQQLTPSEQMPAPSKGITIPAMKTTKAKTGGTQVHIKKVSFTGNTRFTDTVLLNVLGKVSGRSYDFAELNGLADRIHAYYRLKGYSFVRVFLPAQQLKDGLLTIAIVEGRYGRIKASGNKVLARQADKFLARLKPQSMIRSKPLDRAIRILEDQPGIKIIPVIRPGQAEGRGDLDVHVSRGQRITGNIGIDNKGNRYTGRERAHVNMNINSPFLLGDQIRLSALYTSESLWSGSLGYQLPIGGNGLRSNIGYAQTYYKLGKEFSRLDATGFAKVTTWGISYPIIRSQRTNLSISATYQHKVLQDKQGSSHTQNNKSSNSLPISVTFNLRDPLMGGGLTYGSLSWTPGNLNLDSGPNRSIDQSSAKTEGRYHKLNLDLTRIQALPNHLSLLGRVAAQWANKNLDSSEGFGLGGVNGVRAYPEGEGYGDQGWLAQLELRYDVVRLANFSRLTPYLFYDSGRVQINHRAWNSTNNHRSISGAGFGLRANYQKIGTNASLAWSTYGGNPTSDTRHNKLIAWASITYPF